MDVFRRIVFAGVLAGLISGIVVAAAHQAGTVPMILAAEAYEKAGKDTSTWWPTDGFERTTYTILADILTAIGTGLLLLAAYALRGADVDWRKGLYWGLAGFAAFSLWPGIALVPNLPGAAVAPHLVRYVWWIVTASAAAGGLALLFFARRAGLAVVGLALLVLPQLYGAPHTAEYESAIPEALSHQFAITVLLTNFLFWLSLGGLTGFFYKRFQFV